MRKTSYFLILFIGLGLSKHPIPTVHLIPGIEKGVALKNYIGEFQSCEFDIIPNYNISLRNDSLFISTQSNNPHLNTVKINCDGMQHNIMVSNEYTEKVTFEYLHSDGIENIFLMGNFNDWDRMSLPLEKKDGLWKRIVNFVPGNYEYKFVIDQKELIDPLNGDSISNGLGGWNSVLMVKEFQRNPPGEFIKVEFSTKDELLHMKFDFKMGKSRDRVDRNNLYITLDNQAIPKEKYSFRHDTLKIQLADSSNGLLRISAMNNYDQIIPENHTLLFNGQPLTQDVDSTNHHFNIIYSLMVDRFKNGNSKNDKRINDPDLHHLANYHGGDLFGVLRKLNEGYFSELGVNMLWISPLMKNPDSSRTESVPPYRRYSGYHGYWPESSHEIDSRFGTDEILKELVSTAHEQGIRVILDFVANHVHENHPYYMTHPEWFSSYTREDGSVNLRLWDGDTRLTTWFESYLPTFDYNSNEIAIETVTNDAVNQILSYDLDGFRQDATKHIPHSFWKTLTSKLKQAFPGKDVFQIGETFGSPELIMSYVNPAELKSQFNFDLYFKARQVFSSNSSDMIGFNRFVKQNLKTYQPVNLMGTITSSHDQVRFIAFADGQIEFSEDGRERSFTDLPNQVRNIESYDKLFMFSAINFMLPGIPVIYYGEEYGQIGANDPGNRLDMRFQHQWNSNERKFNEKYRKLIKLRRTNSAATLGDLVVLYQSQHCTVWMKKYFDSAILLIFNLNDSTQFFTVHLGDEFKIAESVLAQDRLKISDTNSFLLAPYETRIYELLP